MAIVIEDTDETGVPKVVQRQILDQELAMWRQNRYRLAVRHRVNKRLGADTQVLDQLAKEVEECEKQIDELTAERDAIKGA